LGVGGGVGGGGGWGLLVGGGGEWGKHLWSLLYHQKDEAVS